MAFIRIHHLVPSTLFARTDFLTSFIALMDCTLMSEQRRVTFQLKPTVIGRTIGNVELQVEHKLEEIPPARLMLDFRTKNAGCFKRTL